MRLPDVEINQFQLARLLDDKQKQFFEMSIADNVFCTHCGKICKAGISISEILLTGLNDILVRGACNTCKGSVARMMEFGENSEFYNRAMELRNSIK